MKKFWKILTIVLWILLVAGMGVLVGFTEVAQYDRTCKQVSVKLDYGKADILITKNDVDSLILKTAGMLKGKPLGYVNTAVIENAIRKQPYVEQVNVYLNNEGRLFVDIIQREPILRIINERYESFYLDRSGRLLPVNPDFSARVLVSNGIINASFMANPNFQVNILSVTDSAYASSLLASLYKLAMFISHDKFLKTQIDQIYVNAQQEFELIPRVGNHVILLGDANNLEDKFNKLFVFYRKGLNQIGWNKYNVINIKFKNQVVCSKL